VPVSKGEGCIFMNGQGSHPVYSHIIYIQINGGLFRTSIIPGYIHNTSYPITITGRIATFHYPDVFGHVGIHKTYVIIEVFKTKDCKAIEQHLAVPGVAPPDDHLTGLFSSCQHSWLQPQKVKYGIVTIPG